MSEPTAITAERKYDLYSQETKNNPYGVFASMRQQDPVFCQAGLDGKTMIWFLTRYEDIQLLLSDENRFVRDKKNALPEDLEPENAIQALINNHMLNKDGLEHRRLRNLLAKAFTPTRVQNLRPRVQAIADELLEAVAHKKQMDLLAEYAFPLPMIVICELLGVPAQDREKFKLWSNAMIAPAFTVEAQAQAAELMQAFIAYLGAIFAERRNVPKDDLISALVQAEEAGDQLSQGELFSTVVLLIIAGHETTTNLIGNSVLAMLRQPQTKAQLIADPTLMPNAIEEFLRFDSPVERAFSRWAAQDTVIHGQQIKRGDLVMGILGAGNHDPEKFMNPENLEITRDAKRHLAFGHGMHYCLGAPLARLEGEIALNSLLRHLPTFELADEALIWRTVPMFRGLTSLPVVWK